MKEEEEENEDEEKKSDKSEATWTQQSKDRLDVVLTSRPCVKSFGTVEVITCYSVSVLVESVKTCGRTYLFLRLSSFESNTHTHIIHKHRYTFFPNVEHNIHFDVSREWHNVLLFILASPSSFLRPRRMFECTIFNVNR